MIRETNIVAAVDVGTTKVVVVAGRKLDNGRVEVLGVEELPSEGVRRGVILNIEKTASVIRNAVSSLESRLGIKIEHVYASVAGQPIKCMQNRAYVYINANMEITNQEVDKLKNDNNGVYVDPGYKLLHVLAQEYIVDQNVYLEPPLGLMGRKLEGTFHIVFASETSMSNMERCFHRSSLKTKDVLLEPLASARSVLAKREMEEGVVLVDIGGGSTDVAVYHGGVVRHVAIIPFGSQLVTNDIKEGCSISEKQAESVKKRYGSALVEKAPENLVISIAAMSAGWENRDVKSRNLAGIIQARMEEIVGFVVQQIVKSQYYNRIGAGIVLTGGGANLKDVVDLFKLHTGLDVRLGRAGVSADFLGVYNEGMATVLGLLRHGIEQEEKEAIKKHNADPKLFYVEPIEKTEEKEKQRKKSSEKKEKSKGRGFLEKVTSVVLPLISDGENEY